MYERADLLQDPEDSRPEVSAPEANPALSAEPFAKLPTAISAWVGALQLTVLFAATGFIGKVALQEFLGIDLGNWTALDLSIFAGHWAFDTVSVVLNQIFSHPFVFGIPLLIYLSPVFLPYVLPERLRWKRLATLVSLSMVTIALLVVVSRYEVPTLGIKDWLTTQLAGQLAQPQPGVLNTWRSDLQATLLISKTRDIAGLDQKSCPAVLPDDRTVFSEHYKGDVPADDAVRRLNRIYSYTVLICLAAWFAVYFHAALDAPGLVNELFRGLRLFVCLLLLPIASVLVPYMYAKLIYSTNFPLVSVEYKDPAYAPKDAQKNPSKQFLVMDETDKDISLLLVPTGENLPYVEIESRDEVKKMNRYGKQDVISNIILSQCNPPTQDNPAPQ